MSKAINNKLTFNYVKFGTSEWSGYTYKQGTLTLIRKSDRLDIVRQNGDIACNGCTYVLVSGDLQSDGTRDRDFECVVLLNDHIIMQMVVLFATIIRRIRMYNIGCGKSIICTEDECNFIADLVSELRTNLANMVSSISQVSLLIDEELCVPVGLSIIIDNKVEIFVNPRVWSYDTEKYFLDNLPFDETIAAASDVHKYQGRIPLICPDDLSKDKYDIDDSAFLSKCKQTVDSTLGLMVGHIYTREGMLEIKKKLIYELSALLESEDVFVPKFYDLLYDDKKIFTGEFISHLNDILGTNYAMERAPKGYKVMQTE